MNGLMEREVMLSLFPNQLTQVPQLSSSSNALWIRSSWKGLYHIAPSQHNHLIVCLKSVQDFVKERLGECDDMPCYTACSDFWEDQYYIMDKNRIQDYISQNSELDPFATFGLFMINQATSINLASRSTDPTMDMLYRISLDVYAKILDQDIKYINELKQLNDVYFAQYENIPSLLKDDIEKQHNRICITVR